MPPTRPARVSLFVEVFFRERVTARLIVIEHAAENLADIENRPGLDLLGRQVMEARLPSRVQQMFERQFGIRGNRVRRSDDRHHSGMRVNGTGQERQFDLAHCPQCADGADRSRRQENDSQSDDHLERNPCSFRADRTHVTPLSFFSSQDAFDLNKDVNHRFSQLWAEHLAAENCLRRHHPAEGPHGAAVQPHLAEPVRSAVRSRKGRSRLEVRGR